MNAERSHGLETLDLLVSAIAGRPLRVCAGRPGEAAWTDARAVYVDPEVGARARIESLVVQASLLAAGSLDADVVRSLRGRRPLARRYLAVEGHRALASIEHLLPPSLQSLVDPSVAKRADSPQGSLAEARSRSKLSAAPVSFGAIRPRQLLAKLERTQRMDPAGAHAPADRVERMLAEIAESDEQDDGIAAELFSQPDGSGGSVGRLLSRLLSVVRRLEGGGPPGARAQPHALRARRDNVTSPGFATASAAPVEDGAVADAGTRYPEWDAARRRYRRDWCTVNEVEPRLAEEHGVPALDRYGLRRPLARLGMGLDSCHRQAQGDDVDIDAAIEAHVERMAGSAPDEAIYIDSLRRRRDLSVLVLLDVSGSAAEPAATGGTVHALQRDVAAALTAALHQIGDRVALYAFQSQGRSAVSLLPVKRFDDALDALALRRIQGLVPGAYSRLGAAIRHGATILRERGATSRRLLVVLSDGLAYDHGYEPAYGAADARRALSEARREGIGCLCLTLGASTEAEVLRRVFGSAAHATVPRPSRLGRAIGPLFRSALRSAEARRRVA